jgi:hypothetical protein
MRHGIARPLTLTALTTAFLAGSVLAPRSAPDPHHRAVVSAHGGSVWVDGCLEWQGPQAGTPPPPNSVRDLIGGRESGDVRGDLRGVDLSHWWLAGLTFTACDLRGANLSGARLEGARLWECDLRGANLAGADLAGAWYDPLTRWPSGFDPQAAGARLDP